MLHKIKHIENALLSLGLLFLMVPSVEGQVSPASSSVQAGKATVYFWDAGGRMTFFKSRLLTGGNIGYGIFVGEKFFGSLQLESFINRSITFPQIDSTITKPLLAHSNVCFSGEYNLKFNDDFGLMLGARLGLGFTTFRDRNQVSDAFLLGVIYKLVAYEYCGLAEPLVKLYMYSPGSGMFISLGGGFRFLYPVSTFGGFQDWMRPSIYVGLRFLKTRRS